MRALRRAEQRARERLAADARTAELAHAVFEHVPDGLSNHGWRVRSERLDCFVRLAREGTHELGADHRAECFVLHEVARAGIAPPVVRCDPAQQLLVTRWIESQPTGGTLRRGSGSRRLAAVAARLVELHRLAPPRATRSVDFARQASQLERAAQLQGSDAPLQATATAAFAALAATRENAVLCHHDLHARNLLFAPAGQLWLIDWEYAGLNDPVYDLASYARQHDLPAAQRQRLLQAYRHAGGRSVDPARLEWACWTFDYVQWLWYRAAPIATDAATIDAAAMERHALALEASLRRRARNLLRCNNRQSTAGNARV
jgi:thiamine kinase-like enzyme